jgi:hypothetical protein
MTLTYYKFLHDDMIPVGIEYHEGLNIDDKSIFKVPNAPAGIHFTTFEHLWSYYDLKGDYIREVTIPDGANTYHNIRSSAVMSDKVILGPKIIFEEMQEWSDTSQCELAVKNHGLALQFVKEDIMTSELCYLAIKQNGGALQFVPDEFRTYELCEYAVIQNGSALQYVPVKLRTPTLCEYAVIQNGSVLQFVPNESRTPKLCEFAVIRDGTALQFVPDKFQTPALCELAKRQNTKLYKQFFCAL